jgi:divalent metal cation (Fe/Co/Zn/Cd) transporter
VILSQEAVEGIDRLKTRLFGDKIYVDVEIRADGSTTLEQAHNTAQRVHDAIEEQFPKVKHCMVHVNPVIMDVVAD